MHVSFEDWGSDPTGRSTRSNTAVIARETLSHPGGGQWVLFNFSLTPTKNTSCVTYPYYTPPLNCAIPDSQSQSPPSASGECEVCGGTLTVSVEDAGADVSIDQVFVEPGMWGRYHGLHMHRAAAEWVLAMGTQMARYGGTFTETVQGQWKHMRGQVQSGIEPHTLCLCLFLFYFFGLFFGTRFFLEGKGGGEERGDSAFASSKLKRCCSLLQADVFCL